MQSSCARGMLAASLVATALLVGNTVLADTIEFADGTKLEGCFVRDEATRYLVWEKMSDVGGPPKAIPRSKVKRVRISRTDAWDAHPDLPDLSVTFIELTPKRAGLHGCFQYDKFGRPILRRR